MKKLFTLLLFVTIVLQTHAQHSLDSLRLVLPVGNSWFLTNTEFHPIKKNIFLTVSQDHFFRLWDSESLKELYEINLREKGCPDLECLTEAKFSKTGQYIISNTNAHLKIWETETGKNVSSLHGKFSVWDELGKIITSPNEEYVATNFKMASENIVFIWELKSGKLINKINYNQNGILNLSFSDNSFELKVALENGDNETFLVKKGQIIKQSFIENKSNQWKNIYLLNDSIFVSTHNDSLIFWNIIGDKIKSEYVSNATDYNSFILNQNGRVACYKKSFKGGINKKSFEGRILILDLKNKVSVLEIPIIDGVSSLKFAKNGKSLLILTNLNSIICWDLESSKPNYILNNQSIIEMGRTIEIDFIEISPNSNTFFITFWNSCKVVLYDLISGEKVYENSSSDLYYCAKPLYSNDGQFCLFSENNFELRIINTNRLKRREVKYSCRQNIESVFNLGEKIQVIFHKANSLKNDFSFGVYDFSTCNNPKFIDIDSNSIYYFDKKIMMINDTVNRTFTFSNIDELKKNDFSVAEKKQLKNISEDSLINIIFKTKDIRYFDKSLITSLYKNDLINFSKKNQLCYDSKYLCTQETANTLSVINNIEGSELSKIYLENNIETFFISRNGNRIITNDINGKSIIWNSINGEELFSINEDDNLVGWNRCYFSPMDNYIVMESQEDSESDDITLKFFDFKTGKYLYKIDGSNWMLKKAFFSYDDKYLVLTSWDNSIYIWDLLNKRLHFQTNEHKLEVNNITFTSDSRYMFSSGLDNQIFLWELKSGLKLLQRIELDNNNWLVKLPNSPYYMCSKDASKMLHYVTPSLKVIGFEQLDPVYNRPDIVLDSIGKYFNNDDEVRIDEYRKAWEKRIERLGLNKEMLGKGEIAVPSAEIINTDVQTSKAEKIQYENSSGSTIIHLSANDAKYALRRFNVYVNEVPLYGSAGISIAHLKKQVWDTTVSVPLSVGDNKIQVSVMNELGLENFKYPTYVNYTPKGEVVSKTYFIGIGVNTFRDTCYNLKYCVADVMNLASAFHSTGSNLDTLLLTNKEVTKENVLKLKAFLEKTSVQDKVIISCSSHGLLDSMNRFYLATYDTDFEYPELRGISFESLEGLLDGIPARKKLLLLDACNSGENDTLQGQIVKSSQVKKCETISSKAGKRKNITRNNESFIRMNELFVNVRNKTGSVIISAAGGQQFAWEGEAVKVDGKAIQNGAFTYSILECLEQNKGKELKVNALKQYAEKRVEEITNGKQKPTSRQETMEIDWDVR